MKYQVSLEGHVQDQHAQLNLYDTPDYQSAIAEINTRAHLPADPAEESITLLFDNRTQAIKDGIPSAKIETLRVGDGTLYRYKARSLKE